jgi:cardiolipin synthase
VKVHLILQGRPDIAWAAFAARLVYDQLIEAGVQIHEYCERPLHGKVAVIDGEWATVGSSNLDPLSLSLNLEANVVLRDRAFAAELRGRLLPLIHQRCRTVRLEQTAARRWWWRLGFGGLVFHALRHLPRWAARLPVSDQPLVPAAHSSVLVARTGAAAEAWQWRRPPMAAAQGR